MNILIIKKEEKKENIKNKEDVKDDVDSDGFEIVGSKEEKKQKLREEHRGEYAPRRGRGKWRRNKFWKRRDYENEKKEKDEEKNDKENNEENEEGEENEEEENKEDKEGKEENKEENEKDKKEEDKEDVKEENKEENKEEDKEEKEEEKKEENKEKEEKNEEPKKEETAENDLANEEEEDRKELYEAIQDLKPDEASDNVKSKLIILSEIHLEQKRVENDQYMKEYDYLEDKYERSYAEIDSKIEDVVKSKEKIELTPEEMKQYDIKEESESEIKPIEDYWEKVVINSRYFTITDKDKKILKYLTKVKLIKFPESLQDFKVDFYFNENEYFFNDILSKKYIFGKDSTVKKAEGTSIDWKSSDKNTTVEKIKKKVKKGKKYITETKEQKVDSFFSFFLKLMI